MKRLLLLLIVAANAHAACEAVPLSCGARTESLAASDCAASDASYYDVWQFSGTEGQSVTIDMTSSAFDTFLVLLDPNGTPVAISDDVGAADTSSRIAFTLTSAGTWTVAANSRATNQLGEYTITFACEATGPRRRSVRH